MELLQPSPRTAPASMTLMARRQKINWLLFASSALLCALSTTVLGLISSVVAWIHDQKHQVHVYHVNWPGNPTQINVEPKNVWTDQGHESNGAAVYGFFLGILGMWTAWRMRKTGQVWQTRCLRLFEQRTDSRGRVEKVLAPLLSCRCSEVYSVCRLSSSSS